MRLVVWEGDGVVMTRKLWLVKTRLNIDENDTPIILVTGQRDS